MKAMNEFDADRMADAAYKRGVHEAMILAEESYHKAQRLSMPSNRRGNNKHDEPGMVLLKLRSAACRARISPKVQTSGFRICQMLGLSK